MLRLNKEMNHPVSGPVPAVNVHDIHLTFNTISLIIALTFRVVMTLAALRYKLAPYGEAMVGKGWSQVCPHRPHRSSLATNRALRTRRLKKDLEVRWL
jgi:hypothetical protein